MDKDENIGLKIQWMPIRLVERFMNVLYPIEIPVLLRLLPNIGYIVPQKLYKGIIEPGEALAVKGNTELLLNQDNKTLGLEGNNIKELVERFNELRNFWQEKINPQPPAITHYVEIAGSGFIETTSKPRENFVHYWSGFERMNAFSKFIGFNVINFGIRLVDQSLEPNSPEWFEIRVNPEIISSENRYYINVVWRTKELANSVENINRLEDIIIKAVNEIERK